MMSSFSDVYLEFLALNTKNVYAYQSSENEFSQRTLSTDPTVLHKAVFFL